MEKASDLIKLYKHYRFLSFCVILLLVISYSSIAQTYNTTAGIRFGSRWGLTVKQRIADKMTMEAIISGKYSGNGGAVDLLIQKHNPLIFKRFNFYYGGGLQVGWKNQDPNEMQNTAYGLDLIGGIEGTIGRLNIAWDLVPTINLYNNNRFVTFNSAVSIRYVIVKRKWRLFRKKKDGGLFDF